MGIPCLQEQPHTEAQGSLPLNPITENNSDIPELQSWGVGWGSRCQQKTFTQKCHTAQEACSEQMLWGAL